MHVKRTNEISPICNVKEATVADRQELRPIGSNSRSKRDVAAKEHVRWTCEV